jgi:hypothetical protein
MSDAFKGEPLADDGLKVATLNRGPNRELRIRWKTFKGHPYLDIREWSVNTTNAQWFPEKGRGITIKPRELGAVEEALGQAVRLAQVAE